MQLQMRTLEALHIIGIKTRTTNAEEMKGAGKISTLWEKFFADGTFAKIPGTLDKNIIGVYHDYESDANGPYSLLVGVKVAPGTKAPDGMELLEIPKQNYTLLTTRKGEMPGVVVEAWQKVWELTTQSEINRAYSYDLEVYDERATNPQSCKVDLFIALK